MATSLRRARPKLAGLALVITATTLAACAGVAPTSQPITGAAASPAAPAPSTGLENTPTPTLTTMDFSLLPHVTVDPAKVKVACAAADSGSLSCKEIVALTARIAATMSDTPLKEVAVAKPSGTTSAGSVAVTFWVPSEDGKSLTAFTATIDPADSTVTFPVENDSAVFPKTA